MTKEELVGGLEERSVDVAIELQNKRSKLKQFEDRCHTLQDEITKSTTLRDALVTALNALEEGE